MPIDFHLDGPHPHICCGNMFAFHVYIISKVFFHFKQLMDGTKQLLSNIDCIPIFATIPTMNLPNWNTIRYAQGKTNYLKYENDYGLMLITN